MKREKSQEANRENWRWYGASSAPSASCSQSRTAPTAQETSARNIAAVTTAKDYDLENTQSQAKKQDQELFDSCEKSSTLRSFGLSKGFPELQVFSKISEV